MRNIINFNNKWLFKKTNEIPKALPDQGFEAVTLPHTWNAKDGQDGGDDYYRGTCCYCKSFTRPDNDGDTFIEFNGVAYTAEVYLNGEHLAHHEDGYSTFRVDVTDKLLDSNLICVTVDNGRNDRVYPQRADFTFYGGIYREVNLITVPKKHFELVKDGTPGIKVTPIVSDDMKSATVTVETWQNADGPVYVEIPETGQSQTIESVDGYAKAIFEIQGVHLWDGTADPYLYTVKATFEGDEVKTAFGCRKMEFSATDGFKLNGKIYPLRGVSRHQDRLGLGNALSFKEHEEDMAIIREIGANTVRLAHYQHAQKFYDLCDQYGIIAWAEIPFISSFMPNGRENTLIQMRELITQCYNHPSICCWGLSNEITSDGQMSDALLENHKALNDLCHKMDKTRPTTMAHVFMQDTHDELVHIPDICSYNLYFGWYMGELSENEEFFDTYHKDFPDGVIGFSEYGADANPRFHSDKPERSDYTEEYQCLYHEHVLHCINERPYLWATHVWNMFDFAADGRDEGGEHGLNQKGLVTFDRKTRKDAFYLYKASWNKEPMVHICGRRFADRTGDSTEIKVYSNASTVTVLVDGVEVCKNICPDNNVVFNAHILLTAESHTIKAIGDNGASDEISINKVDTPNPDYIFQKEAIVNWFDKDEPIDPGCYSIYDTLGEIKQNPTGAAIIGKMMAKAQASRGEVAASAANNKNLQRMLDHQTVIRLLSQAGDAIGPEEKKALNAALQKIKKG